MKKENKFTIIIITSLILTITLTEISNFFTECTNINQEVFRLHILANSNSDYDQNMKLLVRDKILELDTELFMSKDITTQTLSLIKLQAESVLQQNNCFLPVQVELTNMYFTTRFYEKYTLPAGNYDALRITIGEAVGDNWWCVLYPPLCLPAATNEVDNILTNEQVEIIANGEEYEFKFALYEFYSLILDFIEN